MDQKDLETLKAKAWDSGWRTGLLVGISVMSIAGFIALII